MLGRWRHAFTPTIEHELVISAYISVRHPIACTKPVHEALLAGSAKQTSMLAASPV